MFCVWKSQVVWLGVDVADAFKWIAVFVLDWVKVMNLPGFLPGFLFRSSFFVFLLVLRKFLESVFWIEIQTFLWQAKTLQTQNPSMKTNLLMIMCEREKETMDNMRICPFPTRSLKPKYEDNICMLCEKKTIDHKIICSRIMTPSNSKRITGCAET